MHNSHVSSLDLRTLRLLAKLLECGSVTLAGETFGLSQPAASRAVARLRRAFGDPLLVRTSRGYTLTPRAREIQSMLIKAQLELDQLFQPRTFDPATSTRRFRLTTTDYGVLTVVPTLLRRLSEAAPHTGLIVSPWTDDTLQRLETGELDAALYIDAPLPQDFYVRALFEDRYAILYDPSVLEAEAVATRTADFNRVVLLYPDKSRLRVDDPLARLGHAESQIVLAVPYFATMTAAIKGTSYIAAVPLRVAARLQADSELAFTCDPPLQDKFQFRLIWHHCTQRDADLAWFRSKVVVDLAEAKT